LRDRFQSKSYEPSEHLREVLEINGALNYNSAVADRARANCIKEEVGEDAAGAAFSAVPLFSFTGGTPPLRT